MTQPIIRRAIADDLPQINAIYYAAEVEASDPNPPPLRQLAYFGHVLSTGELWVAEAHGALIGYSGRIVRGNVAYLTDLFTREQQQSGGIGRALLDAAMPPDTPIRCTLASRDPRAIALYTRIGMQPRWPNIWLLTQSERLRALPPTSVSVTEADADDPALLAWDASISGRERIEDVRHWRAQCNAVPVWFERAGARIGYGYIQMRSDTSFAYPDAVTLGPLGSEAPGDAANCVLAAVDWARTRNVLLRIALPGPHSALAPLLDAGFRITYVETFCSSSDEPFFDPRCYVSGGDLL